MNGMSHGDLHHPRWRGAHQRGEGALCDAFSEVMSKMGAANGLSGLPCTDDEASSFFTFDKFFSLAIILL